MKTWAGSSGQFKVFAYLQAEKAASYAAILRLFSQAKARFALHLRPAELLAALQALGVPELSERAEVDALLRQLCDWGNLAAHPDTTDVATVDEFYRPRYFYQLTPEGEAAERALDLYREEIRRPGELQAAALNDIHVLLRNLAARLDEARLDEAHLDEGEVHRTLLVLRDRFDELTAKAQTFVGSLQRTMDLHGFDLEAFLAYKQTLIEYLERFVGELVLVTGDIGAVIQQFDAADLDRLLEIAAGRDLADALLPTEADRQAARQEWTDRWQGLRGWFVSRPEAPSQAEMLRARARAAIPALLSAVAGLHDRRLTRSDRASDFRTLARWFAETDRDEEAHRLWRAAFALVPARHLSIDAETLADRDETPVPPQTSWLNAPPLRIAPRLRAIGRQARPPRQVGMIDHTREKLWLAQLAETEVQQIAAAQQRLALGKTLRLSELTELNPAEFDLFLDLLGEALAAQTSAEKPVEAISSDGTLRITLCPTPDGARAVIPTSTGSFAGRDHFITIRKVLPVGHAEIQSAVWGPARNPTAQPTEVEAV